MASLLSLSHGHASVVQSQLLGSFLAFVRHDDQQNVSHSAAPRDFGKYVLLPSPVALAQSIPCSLNIYYQLHHCLAPSAAWSLYTAAEEVIVFFHATRTIEHACPSRETPTPRLYIVFKCLLYLLYCFCSALAQSERTCPFGTRPRSQIYRCLYQPSYHRNRRHRLGSASLGARDAKGLSIGINSCGVRLPPGCCGTSTNNQNPLVVTVLVVPPF